MRQFSTALAHELRTPLAVLRGEIELGLRHADGDERARQMFANELEAIDRLKRLIDQILTLARAESGQMALAAAPVDVGELVRSLVEQLQPVADARGSWTAAPALGRPLLSPCQRSPRCQAAAYPGVPADLTACKSQRFLRVFVLRASV